MTEKQLYDATEVEKVLRTLEKNFMGVSPRGKEQANVVAFVRKHISAIPKVTPENLQLLTYNEDVEYQSIDSFACHNCGTWIENWNKVEEDSGGCRHNAGWYVPKCCPECGAKIISHKSCAFCRWHLQDGTCFNKLEKRSTTDPENTCECWEARTEENGIGDYEVN